MVESNLKREELIELLDTLLDFNNEKQQEFKKDKENRQVSIKIAEKVAVLSENPEGFPEGWKKELNMVSWNHKEPVLDIRCWNEDHTRMSKGISLTHAEFSVLLEVILKSFEKVLDY